MVALANPPAFACRARGRAARKGYAFEAKLEKRLARLAAELGWELWVQQWLWEKDKYHCPDFVLISPAGCAIILEAKLTYCETGNQRLVYEELLEAMGYSTMSVTVCRNLTPEVNRALVVDELESLFPECVVHLWL